VAHITFRLSGISSDELAAAASDRRPQEVARTLADDDEGHREAKAFARGLAEVSMSWHSRVRFDGRRVNRSLATRPDAVRSAKAFETACDPDVAIDPRGG
jgi:hypothetical protein